MKYKKIVAFGDSFVQGLIKEPHEISSEEMKRINFITRLGEINNIPVENFGWRGHGQTSIAYDVVDYLENNKPSKDILFLVVWSGYARKMHFSKDTLRYTGFSNTDSRELENAYHKVDLNFMNTINIRGTYSLLKQIEQPFVMLNSFINLFDIEDLNLKGLEDRWIKETLFEMCIGEKRLPENYHVNHNHHLYYKTNHPNLAQCMHPSEKGHKVIAEKLQNYIEMY